MKRTIFIFGGLTIVIFLLFQLSRISLFNNRTNNEFLVYFAGISFIAVGYLLSRLFTESGKKEFDALSVESEKIKNSGLSSREYEILILMAKGLSNLEIGRSLFISVSTVKSHISSIFTKLNARRRTEAIQIARDLRLL